MFKEQLTDFPQTGYENYFYIDWYLNTSHLANIHVPSIKTLGTTNKRTYLVPNINE